MEAKQYQIQQYGTIVVEYMGRKERITNDAEQDVTNALIKVLTPSQKKVYFLGGHGEKDTASSDRTGYSGIADALKRDNFEFDKLVLAQAGQIPADATVLVLAGPQTDLLEQEVPDPARLDHEVRQAPGPDGSVRQLQGTGRDAAPHEPADRVGHRGHQVRGGGPERPDARWPRCRWWRRRIPTHAITDRFNLITLFPMVRAIVPAANPPSGRTPQPILQTHQRSWAEMTLTQLETPEALKPEPDKGDLAGPVTIGVAVSVSNKAPEPAAKPDTPAAEPPAAAETRVVAVGDSDFASNAYLGVEGNRDLFMNTVNWLAQQESLISIRPRDPADRRLTLTAAQLTMMFWLSLVVVPGLVMGTGIYTWWRRRG